MDLNDDANWITTAYAAALAGIGEQTLRAIDKDNPGKFTHKRIGRNVMWRRDQIEQLVRERRGEGG